MAQWVSFQELKEKISMSDLLGRGVSIVPFEAPQAHCSEGVAFTLTE